MSVAQANIEASKHLLHKLMKAPLQSAKAAWEMDKKYSPKELEAFIGPDDPNYAESLRTEYEASLQRNEARMRELRKQYDGN
jgi:hypothetical protein